MPNKGDRDLLSLSTSSIEKRHHIVSQTRAYYAVRSPDYSKRTRSPAPPTSPPPPHVVPDIWVHVLPDRVRLTPEAASNRRVAIKYVFQEVCLSPPKDAWLERGTIPYIMRVLTMPDGSYAVVYRVLSTLEIDPHADVASEKPGKGRHSEIVDCTEQAKFIYHALESGNTISTTTVLINAYFRKPKRLKNLSYSTVARFVHSSPYISIARRKMRKSGKEDADTVWSKARLAFAKQLKEQIRLGRLSPAELTAANSVFPPLYLDGIAWWDEHHKKVILGHTSVNETRIYRNDAGIPTLPSDGGTLAPCRPNVSMKYPGEARMLFGVAMVKNAAGDMSGVKAAPFCYTSCQILGIPGYDKACEEEKRRVKALKTKVSKGVEFE
jgi:hypothetical protein